MLTELINESRPDNSCLYFHIHRVHRRNCPRLSRPIEATSIEMLDLRRVLMTTRRAFKRRIKNSLIQIWLSNTARNMDIASDVTVADVLAFFAAGRIHDNARMTNNIIL